MNSIDLHDVARALSDLRAARPLVHNITNYVAMTLSANVLLAIGASPAMVHAVEEVEDFVAISSSLVVNIGTLSPRWVEAMGFAARKANSLGKPWVLDPVGCGATAYRTNVAVALAGLRPTIIRGNASEIMSLAGAAGAGGQGVDSTASSSQAIDSARALAAKTGAVVAVTGEVDYVCDARETVGITGGHPLMPLATALGCSLSAVTAAFAATRTAFEATVAAMAVYGAAGREAALRCAGNGPGHLPAELCDALYGADLAMLERHAAIRPSVTA